MTTSENGFLNRESFLSKRDRRIKEVSIPDFGKVRVQALSAYERGKLEATFSDKKGGARTDRMAKLREYVAVASVVDADGNRMFSDSDVDALGQVPAHALEAILKAYQELNGSDNSDIEALVKN